MTEGRADGTTGDSETTGAAMTDGRADGTTGDSEATVAAMTDGRADGTATDRAKAVQPVEVGNGMDDLNDVLLTTTFDEQKENAPGMRTIDHRVISGNHVNLSGKTNERDVAS